MTFTTEEIRMLAEAERKMDSGEIMYVVLHGERASVIPEVAAELGLVAGQTINDAIFVAILEASIRHCEREIAKRKHPN